MSSSCDQPKTKATHENKLDTLTNQTLPILVSDSTNTLEKNIKILKLQYTLWGCACANWITSEDANNYLDSGFTQHHIFIEPANSSIYNPAQDSTFDIWKEKIIVTGQFYTRYDYPHPTYQMEEHLEKARVFKYTKIKRIKEKVDK